VSFSAAASAIYIVNDFFDLALDRKHPTKRKRPLASGIVSMKAGMIAILILLLPISFGVALLLPIEFLGVLCDLSVGHDRLLVLGQAHAFARRYDAGWALHDAHPGRRGCDRH
jgi:hypothetical protein